MKYNEETYENIKSRILASMSNELDKREGSIINDMVSPISVEFAKNYIQLGALLDTFFLENIEGEDLEKRASDFGIIRKEAQYASGYVRLYGENGFRITNEMTLYTDDGLGYQIVVDDEIGYIEIVNEYVDVYVVALETGKIYNVQSNSIRNIDPFNEKITDITNTKEFTGGADTETDEELIGRLKDYLANPATSGNEAYYRQKCLEIPGVNGVKLVSKWNGPGTLKIIVYYDNKPVSAEVLGEAKAYIEECRVVDANITVITPEKLNLNIKISATINSSYSVDLIIEEFKNNLNDYLDKCDNKVIYHKVVSCLSIIDGVDDFSEVLLNSATSNISYADESRPYVNKITINGYEG